MRSIDGTELKKYLRNNDFYLIDVREPDEYEQGHVPEAVNIPLGKIVAAANGPDNSKELFLYCASGSRAARAGDLLERLGFNKVTVCPDSWEVIASGDESLAVPAYCRWTPDMKKLMTD